MSTYAIAHLKNVDLGPDILQYIREIDATLEPYDGRFLVHGGGNATAVEGELPGDVVIIAFPDRRRAEDWYASEAYQRILPLRTEHADCVTFLIDGVPEGYRAASFADKIAAGA